MWQQKLTWIDVKVVLLFIYLFLSPEFILLDENIYIFYYRNIKGHWLRCVGPGVLNLIYLVCVSSLKSKNSEYACHQDFQIRILNPCQCQHIKLFKTNLRYTEVLETYWRSVVQQQGSRNAGTWWGLGVEPLGHLYNVGEVTWANRTWGSRAPNTELFGCGSRLCKAFVKLVNITDFSMSKRALEVLLGGRISVSSCSLLFSDLLKQLELFLLRKAFTCFFSV